MKFPVAPDADAGIIEFLNNSGELSVSVYGDLPAGYSGKSTVVTVRSVGGYTENGIHTASVSLEAHGPNRSAVFDALADSIAVMQGARYESPITTVAFGPVSLVSGFIFDDESFEWPRFIATISVVCSRVR